jgi:hypothetical protein
MVEARVQHDGHPAVEDRRAVVADRFAGEAGQDRREVGSDDCYVTFQRCRGVAADISRNLTVDRPVVSAVRIGMNVSSGQMHQNDDSRGARRRGPSSLSRLGVVNCLPAAYAERDLLLAKARVGAIVA